MGLSDRFFSRRREPATLPESDRMLREGAQYRAGTWPMPPQAPPFLQGLPPEGVPYEPQEPVNRALRQIIEEHAYASNFIQAIAAVRKQKIPELREIGTLDQFYFYLDRLVRWIPEIRVWAWNGQLLHERTVYLRICQFYYYFNQPSLRALQTPVSPGGGCSLSPISQWLRDFAMAWGTFLDSEESCAYLESFQYAPEFAWQDFERPPQDYPSFNAFFARQFKDIDKQRPVAQPDDDRVIVFPAESTFVGHWPISTSVGDPLPAPASVVIKHIEWPIRELLRDSAYAADFEGGVFCHSFLNTFDYHRMHAPVSGTVLEAKFISGQVHLQVELQESDSSKKDGEVARTVVPRRCLDAEDATGYQFVQCRGLWVLDTVMGKVAVLPIGMAQVSSVVFVTSARQGHEPIVLTEEERKQLDREAQVARINERLAERLVGEYWNKGEMFSYFQFGGSDCVVLFSREACVDVTAKVGVHYPVRSTYAIAHFS